MPSAFDTCTPPSLCSELSSPKFPFSREIFSSDLDNFQALTIVANEM